MNKDANTPLGIGLMLLFVLGAALTVFPNLRSSALAQSEIAGFREELAKPNAGPEAIALLEERLDTLRQLGDDRITPIPRGPDQAGLVREMSVMFERGGIAPPQMTTGVAQLEMGAMAMPMTVVANGAYTPIVDAVRSIESLPRLVRVRRVRIASEGTGSRGPIDRSGMIRADLLLDVFYTSPGTSGGGTP